MIAAADATPLRPARRARWLALLLFATFGARGQETLYVVHGSTAEVVRAVAGTTPQVERGGKLVPVLGGRFQTEKVPEYLPVFIAVRKWGAVSTREYHANNRWLDYRGEFESMQHLKSVFAVFVVKFANGETGLFVKEIGEMLPREPREIEVNVPIAKDTVGLRFWLHLYVDGREALSSQVPFDAREAALDRMIGRRVQGASDGPPRAFTGPVPEYPRELREAHVAGSATLEFLVTRNGSVQDPKVAEATDPRFGAAALAAIRMWRFLPLIRDHEPAEMRVALPFQFGMPPAKP